jgi:hypothetical protein
VAACASVHYVGFDSVTVGLVLIEQQLAIWSHSGRFHSYVTVDLVPVEPQLVIWSHSGSNIVDGFLLAVSLSLSLSLMLLLLP